MLLEKHKYAKIIELMTSEKVSMLLFNKMA